MKTPPGLYSLSRPNRYAAPVPPTARRSSTAPRCAAATSSMLPSAHTAVPSCPAHRNTAQQRRRHLGVERLAG
eukprot:1376209-Prymnesium_polylepis.1